jgi:GT2 family glycosyltransferase
MKTVLSIIIVSYNTKDFLRSCLLSLQEQTISTQIIVVDNASSDESCAMVKKEFPEVLLIENKQNSGFSKANNIGVKRATGQYVLFLNPDTIVPKGVLATMVSHMENNAKVGAATCKVALINGELDDACHRGFPTPWNSFCHFFKLSHLFPHSPLFTGYSLSWMDMEKPHEIDACAGAFMLVHREAGEAVSWWDEDYFWYGEDIDFCYRLKEVGWKIYYYPDVSIEHYTGVAGGIKNVSKHITTATKETKERATFARFEAMRIFYRKHYQNRYPRLVTWCVQKGIAFLQRRALRRI